MSETHDILNLDHNATTPMLPEAAEAMARFVRSGGANPSSVHRLGRAARAVLHEARATAATAIGAKDSEIVFTSSGTESISLALRGILGAWPAAGHLIISAVEHPAVQETAQDLASSGHVLHQVGVDSEGRVRVADILASVRSTTRLVSLMLANNEIGTLEPVSEVAAALAPLGIPLHTDAVQAFGRIRVDVNALGVAALSLSGHKFGGPMGTGLLYLRDGTPFRSSVRGGKQELGRRAGTENVPAIVGMAEAMRLATARLPENEARVRTAVAAFLDEIESFSIAFTPNGPEPLSPGTLANTLNLAFEGVDAQALLVHLDLEGVAASSGSACSSGSIEPSPVLAALGLPEARARCSIRLSLGPETDAETARIAARRVGAVVRRLKR